MAVLRINDPVMGPVRSDVAILRINDPVLGPGVALPGHRGGPMGPYRPNVATELEAALAAVPAGQELATWCFFQDKHFFGKTLDFDSDGSKWPQDPSLRVDRPKVI